MFSTHSSVKDGSVVAISGFNLATTPEHLIIELYELYEKTGHPKGIFVMSDALPAVPGRALDTVCEQLYRQEDQRFLRGILMPYLRFAPWMEKLVLDEVAPDIDLGKNVLGRMEFKVTVSRKLKEMDKALFSQGRMGAKELISRISRR